MVQAIMFDLDGTLLDTLHDLAQAANRALDTLGFPTHPVEDYRYHVGDGVEKLIKRILPADSLETATIAEGCRLMRLNYAQCWAENSAPYPGVPELLTALTERQLPMAILSNKPDDFTREMVQTLLPDWPFVIVRGAHSGVPIKPDPSSAYDILTQLNLAPGSCLYLGDTNTDMKTAVNAGMFPVGALWGFREENELRNAGASALAKHPLDIIPLLAKS